MQVESQSFDAWIAADLRQQFGPLEEPPDEWLELIDEAAHLH